MADPHQLIVSTRLQPNQDAKMQLLSSEGNSLLLFTFDQENLSKVKNIRSQQEDRGFLEGREGKGRVYTLYALETLALPEMIGIFVTGTMVIVLF